MILTSDKRAYTISLKEKQIKSILSLLKTLDDKDIQRYIDKCFSMSVGHAYRNKIREKEIWRDKAKLAILFKEGIKQNI